MAHMPPLITDICRNPDHDLVQGRNQDPTPPTWYRSTRAGRPRLFCDKRCQRWYHHNYEDGVRVPRAHNARSWAQARRRFGEGLDVARDGRTEDSARDIAKVLATDPGDDHHGIDPATYEPAPRRVRIKPEFPRSTSLFVPIATDDRGNPLTIDDTLTDTHGKPSGRPDEDPDMLHPIIHLPLDQDGFPGISVRAHHHPRGMVNGATAILGDGIDFAIVRRSDGAVMSTSHPDAPALVALLTSELWQDRWHLWLEGLRDAAAAGQLDGPAPGMPAQDVRPELN
jgi:hypothetical protein